MTSRAASELNPESVRQGATIREFRVMRGLTQDQLANASLISRAYLANIETGRKAAGGKVVSRIAAALSVPQISIIRPDAIHEGSAAWPSAHTQGLT